LSLTTTVFDSNSRYQTGNPSSADAPASPSNATERGIATLSDLCAVGGNSDDPLFAGLVGTSGSPAHATFSEAPPMVDLGLIGFGAGATVHCWSKR
jgi:hypothetical protein